jgi:predicted nucleotidyltransferase component of viral defense system
MLRVKAWLVLRRNATRDYLDVVALADRLGTDASAAVALSLDDYYDDQQGAGGRRIATQLARQLAEPAPYDLSDVDLGTYRELEERWREWGAVAGACRALATAMLTASAGDR